MLFVPVFCKKQSLTEQVIPQLEIDLFYKMRTKPLKINQFTFKPVNTWTLCVKRAVWAYSSKKYYVYFGYWFTMEIAWHFYFINVTFIFFIRKVFYALRFHRDKINLVVKMLNWNHFYLNNFILRIKLVQLCVNTT